MTGEVEVVSDTGTKKELWQDWFIHHFPKGPEDPEYILLKFRGNHATIWIDGQFVHRIGIWYIHILFLIFYSSSGVTVSRRGKPSSRAIRVAFCTFDRAISYV